MALRKFIIERDIPAVGSLEREQLRGAAAKSNQVLNQLGPDIQWVESYVAADKTFCVVSGKGRGHHSQARGDQRISGDQDHRGAQDDRSHHRACGIVTRTCHLEHASWPDTEQGGHVGLGDQRQSVGGEVRQVGFAAGVEQQQVIEAAEVYLARHLAVHDGPRLSRRARPVHDTGAGSRSVAATGCRTGTASTPDARSAAGREGARRAVSRTRVAG